MIRHAKRPHGPWCIVRIRAPFGIQIIHKSRSKMLASKWRTRHREHFHNITLFMLSEAEVYAKNAEALATDAYWKIIDNISAATEYEEAVIIDVEAWTPTYGVPAISPDAVQLALTSTRYKRNPDNRLPAYVDEIINRMQENTDALRVVKRRLEIGE